MGSVRLLRPNQSQYVYNIKATSSVMSISSITVSHLLPPSCGAEGRTVVACAEDIDVRDLSPPPPLLITPTTGAPFLRQLHTQKEKRL